MAVARAYGHQRQQRARGPADHRAGVHGRLVGLVVGLGHGRAVAAQQLFPAVPGQQVIGPLQQGLEARAAPQRVGQGARQHRVVVQDGADVDHIKLGPRPAQGQHGPAQPGLQLVALLGAAYLLVVLDVVKYAQVRPIRAVAQAAQLLAAARHLHLGVAARHDGAGLPDPALPHLGREVQRQAGVELKLGLDGFEHRVGLVNRVHHDHRIPFAASDQAPQHKQLADQGALGLAPGRGDGIGLAVGRSHDLGQALKQVVVQLAARGAADVVREIGLREEPKIILRLRAALLHGGRVGAEARYFGLDALAQ